MNIHSTSHPAKSGPDELVPSRYALKVGDIDVLVVSDGVLPLPTKMLGHNANPTDRGFEHDPEEAARVRVRLLRELAGTGEMLVATHLPFPSIGRVAVDGDAFRWVPVFWDY